MRHRHRMVGVDAEGGCSLEVIDPQNGSTHLLRVNVADYDRWMTGAPVQECFPYLGRAQREILITGIGPEAWRAIFGPPSGDGPEVET